MHITEPTAIQAEAIPVIAGGKDTIVQSQTGTGKTLAYLLPALQRIDPKDKHIQAMVLVPTRELGMQIMREIEKLTADGPIRSQQLIGGAALSRQVEKLKQNPHIVVGTPGRVTELIKLRKLSLHHIKLAIVDEVDQVFDLGSMNEVETVLRSMQKSRQIVFVSATIPDSLAQAAQRWMQEPTTIRINPQQRTAETLEHYYFVCDQRDKIDTLRRLVRLYNPPSAIVFVNATADVAEVVEKIKYVGLSIEALYGEAGKQERANVLNAFREQKFQLLLATDVAARGLDIEGVTHVFHLDPPINADYYLHRVGRTGRMGRKGTAISIVTPRELFIVEKFEKALGIRIAPKAMYEGRVVDPAQDRSAAAMRNRRVAARAASPVAPAGAARPDAQRQTRDGAGHPRVAAPDMPGGARNATASGSSSRRAGGPQNGANTPARKAERERDRKSKGAPKWLKAKQGKE